MPQHQQIIRLVACGTTLDFEPSVLKFFETGLENM